MNQTNGRLAGKVAIITGGASGFGALTAKRFVAEGARVCITDLDEAKGKAVAEELGADGMFMPGDHADAARDREIVEKVVKTWGSLDILYNNAGVGWVGPFENCTPADYQRVVRACLDGAWHMSQAAAPALRESGRRNTAGSALLFTSSGLGLHARPAVAAYTAVKHAIVGLMRSLAIELGADNVRVNAICPGMSVTPAMQAVAANWGKNIDDVVEQFRAEAPLKRIADPEDIANAALFLCSDESKSITAHALVVDCGTIGY